MRGKLSGGFRFWSVLISGAVLMSACSATPVGDAAAVDSSDSGRLVGARGYEFPPAPAVPSGSLDAQTSAAVDRLVESAQSGLDFGLLEEVAASGDARLAWVVADLMRFLQGGEGGDRLVVAFEALTGVSLAADPTSFESPWRSVTDHLIAWDLPAPPGYQEMKAELFLLVEPGWAPFFADVDSEIDWRLVSWGGVLIDDRTLGDPNPCERGCIPALDDPPLTGAAEGDWYPDDAIVFGLVVGDEAVALPQNMMEVHEMVNISLGGRRIGIPYCTLCGSAQAYFLDSISGWQEQVVLRTSGLLARSNKVMYDLTTKSVLDTFTGVALSGPLREAGVRLEQTTVVGSSWGDWKKEHPATQIIAQSGGLGRSYEDDPLGGRDDNGPIFPVGDVDLRLDAQARVVGVIDVAGEAVAFPLAAALEADAAGSEVVLGSVTLVRDGGGFRAIGDDGAELAAHQAFWFAWSQFHPATKLWSGP